MNVHHKCQKKVANLCGVNQKLMAEALATIENKQQVREKERKATLKLEDVPKSSENRTQGQKPQRSYLLSSGQDHQRKRGLWSRGSGERRPAGNGPSSVRTDNRSAGRRSCKQR